VSLKRKLIRTLDNGVGRPLLSWLATAKARQILQADVVIAFDNGWYHRVDGYYVPDGSQFDYYEPDVLSWKDQISTFFRDSADFWFAGYTPKLGDIIVDVGAGRGEDILPFLESVGPDGRVYAVEAHPVSFAYLKRLCDLNNFRIVIPIHAAIMDKPGVVQIGDDENWVFNSIRSDGRGASVRAMTLDELCRDQNIEYIDFLKMNIEGVESLALLGMSEMLPKISQLCICAHDFRADRGHGERFRTRSLVEEFLKRNGYTVSRRVSDPRDYVRDHVFARREST
jgi:FkbM family methyltransferase